MHGPDREVCTWSFSEERQLRHLTPHPTINWLSLVKTIPVKLFASFLSKHLEFIPKIFLHILVIDICIISYNRVHLTTKNEYDVSMKGHWTASVQGKDVFSPTNKSLDIMDDSN